ncbi:hypothetical protein RJ641_019278 [Dillenia turbinata]|uniref:Leucine-rich repeat-containing N-terminal plant-type domain-containing protein n=1 Tax=Dillenia turbinata TaxID=194707 RepID=A0AAN8UTF1_9MAGN
MACIIIDTKACICTFIFFHCFLIATAQISCKCVGQNATICTCAPPPPPSPPPPLPPPPPPPPPPPQPAPLPSPEPSPPPLVFPDVKIAEAYPVVQQFKQTITSDPLNITSSWVGPDVCSYKGFYCENPPDNATALTIAAVNFNGFQLSAPSLDGFVDNLPDLAIFHANTNNFSGTLSPKIGQLRFLYELDLSNNKFSGPFPYNVLTATGLTYFDIRFNSFSGSVPPEIFMQTLEVLFLNNNNFMQTLPADFGSTPVFYLTLANNNFTGPIPRSIGNLNQTLIEVLFLNNQFNGCLPHEVGYLNQTTVFDVGNNLLTGLLPSSLACMEKVEQLNLAGNMFYGHIPDKICALAQAQNLSLSNNYFTGVGSLCKKLIKGGVLDVRRNCISDFPDQRSSQECANFLSKVKICPTDTVLVPCQTRQSPPTSHRRRSLRGSSTRRWVTYSTLERHRLM